MNKLLAGLLTCLTLIGAPFASAANRTGTDFGDMWWNPAESGWGVNIDHQGTILFMTLYTYGADGRAQWYISSSMPNQGGFAFTGALLAVTGPANPSPFNTGSVSYALAGSATVTFDTISTGTLVYSVNGRTVTKAIQRYTFATNSMDGSYIGGVVAVERSCGQPTRNAATFTITQSGGNATIVTQSDTGIQCSVTGAYTQDGRMGSLIGTQQCSNGTAGQFQAFEIETGYQGLLARYAITFPSGCTESGRFGGLAQ